MHGWRLWSLVAAACAYCGAAHGADISVSLTEDDSPATVTIIGDIALGDADAFRADVADLDEAIIILSSHGGSVNDAIDIGTFIHDQKFSTYVPAHSSCFSACGIIWIGGTSRYAAPTANIGFHAAFTRDREGEHISSDANAVVGAFFGQMGLNYRAIAALTSEGPSTVLTLNPKLAARFDIAVTWGKPPETERHTPQKIKLPIVLEPAKPAAEKDDRVWPMSTRGNPEFWSTEEQRRREMLFWSPAYPSVPETTKVPAAPFGSETMKRIGDWEKGKTETATPGPVESASAKTIYDRLPPFGPDPATVKQIQDRLLPE